MSILGTIYNDLTEVLTKMVIYQGRVTPLRTNVFGQKFSSLDLDKPKEEDRRIVGSTYET